VEWIQANIIWMLASVAVVSFTGLVIILLLMNRRKMAFSRAGTKPRRVPAKQTAPVGKSAIVSAPLVSQPITAPAASIEQRVNTAIALSKAGKHQESFAMLKEVVKVDPNNAQAWLYLGVNLVNLKDFVNAERCIQRAKALGHPQADQARNWLAKKSDGNQS
jgi:tetratricopeptide (TPR) repeat protein